MASSFPLECAGCKKQIESEEVAYTTYKCRKGHIWSACKVECLRILEKKCDKCMAAVDKVLHKLNNDGHTSALRRLPPGEREKMKQHAEATNDGKWICPLEVKAAEKSAPYCAHVMFLSRGPPQDRPGDGEEEAPAQTEASPSSLKPGSPAADDDDQLKLVDLDQLVPLRGAEGDDSLGRADEGKGKKKGKKKLDKGKKIPLVGLDISYRMRDTVEAADGAEDETKLGPSVQVSRQPTPSLPPDVVGGSAWMAGRKDPRAGPQRNLLPRPADFQARVHGLVELCEGMSESKAIEILETYAWDLENAANAVIEGDLGGGDEPQLMSAVGRPRWGPRAGVSVVGQSAVEPRGATVAAASPASAAQANAGNTTSTVGDHAAVTPTATAGDGGYPGGAGNNVMRSSAVDGHAIATTGREATQTATSTQVPNPLPGQPMPPWTPKNWQALWDHERQRWYYWHMPTNHTTWEPPTAEEGQAPPEVHNSAQQQQQQQQQQSQQGRAHSFNIVETHEEERALKSPLQQSPARSHVLGQDQGQPRILQANGIAQSTRAAISEEERQRAAFAAMEERARERQREKALEEQRQAEKEVKRRAMLVEEATNTTGCTDQTAREVLEAQNWDMDAAVRILSAQEEQRIRKMQAMAAARAAEEAQLEEQRRLQAAAAVVQRNIRIGQEYACTRHFRPLPTIQSAIRLIQGERVRVDWTDGSPQGWAFGTVIDRPEETGYFPCEVLCERDAPRRRQVGERCSVREEFKPIENMGGYLHIRPGETVEVLHMEPSCVWAYVQLDLPAGQGTMEHQGWVPETSLSDLVPQAPVAAG